MAAAAEAPAAEAEWTGRHRSLRHPGAHARRTSQTQPASRYPRARRRHRRRRPATAAAGGDAADVATGRRAAPAAPRRRLLRLLCGLLTRDASVRLGAGGAAEVMRHPWLRPVEFELLRRGVPLPAPFVPDSRLVYARDDLAGGPRSQGGVDDAPAEGAADGEATIDVAGWEFHGGGWKDELQEYASKARL